MEESRWGFRIAVTTAGLAVLSLAVAISTPPRSGPFCRSDCLTAPYSDAARFVPRDYLWMYPAMLLVIATLVLFGYLGERVVRPQNRWPAGVGRSLAGVAATVLLIDYGVQLFVLQPQLLAGRTEDLGSWLQYQPSGIFIGLENTGYAALALGFSFFGMALITDGTGLIRAAGRILLVGGGLTVLLLVVLAAVYRSDLTYRFEVWSIMITWLVLAITGVLLAVAERR